MSRHVHCLYTTFACRLRRLIPSVAAVLAYPMRLWYLASCMDVVEGRTLTQESAPSNCEGYPRTRYVPYEENNELEAQKLD